jgi:uncharacterized protein (UPF0261 family)
MAAFPHVVLFGALDTKGEEYAYLRDLLARSGCQVCVVDVGVLGTPGCEHDISRAEVASAASADIARLAADGDRGHAVDAMARGAAVIAARLHRSGRLDAALAAGGSNAAHVFSAVAAALPFGVPKLLAATVAAGDTRPYVGTSDLTLMYPVVDINGLNRISREVLANAAAAIDGMARRPRTLGDAGRPVAAITVFGVTTAAATAIRHRLERRGFEVLTFAGNGTGGRTMEALVRSGMIDVVVDLTTTELADDLVGGVCSAGPDRLTAATETGTPQVVSLGALDMVNFGPPSTVPPHLRSRRLHAHNPSVTLLRTSVAECAELGRRIARKLNRARGTVAVLAPRQGLSQLSVAGQPFHDPAADAALLDGLTAGLAPHVEMIPIDADINDPTFAAAMADRAVRAYDSRKESSDQVKD